MSPVLKSCCARGMFRAGLARPGPPARGPAPLDRGPAFGEPDGPGPCRPPPRQPRRSRRRYAIGPDGVPEPPGLAWPVRHERAGRHGRTNARHRCRRVIGIQRRRWPVPLWPGGSERVRWPARDGARRRPVWAGIAASCVSLRAERPLLARVPTRRGYRLRDLPRRGRLEVFGCAERLLLKPPMSAGGNRDHGASNNQKGRPIHNLCTGRRELEVNPSHRGRPGYLHQFRPDDFPPGDEKPLGGPSRGFPRSSGKR